MRQPTTVASFAVLCALVAACGTSGETESASSNPEVEAGSPYPLTVTNCGVDVTFEAEPERMMLLKSAAVPYLQELGVLDDVVARAGLYPEEYYDEATNAALAEIPLLTDQTDTGGHLQISKEVVIAQEPDLVLGEVENLNRDTLSAVGIPLLEEPGLCPEGIEDPGFDDVYSQMTAYGKVFNREEEAASAVEELKERVGAVEDTAGSTSTRTAAVLYPTVGGGVTYAYGSKSMAAPQLEAAGFENVFADTNQRVFEVTFEELLGRDPDVIIMLYTDGDPAKVEEAVTSLPGAGKLTAVRNGDLMTQLFNFTEPPSPLALEGLERIQERFGGGQ
ncbi:MAG: ABC transporter substrate-binding protein [Ornithinimicrobium sp.]